VQKEEELRLAPMADTLIVYSKKEGGKKYLNDPQVEKNS
jgi:hypothetical protein